MSQIDSCGSSALALIGAKVRGGRTVAPAGGRHRRAVDVVRVADVDAAINGRTGGLEPQVAAGRVDEQRVADQAADAHDELPSAAEVEVVILVERGVGVADLADRLDDVIS